MADREFDHWLRTQPDRCRSCGFHPPTQGHRAGCAKGRKGHRG